MTIIRRPRNRGFTIVETVISFAVFAVISSMGAFLIFMVGRNAVNVHDQVLTQVAATNANERLASVLRNASHFAPFSTDAGSATPLTRLLVAMPLSTGGVTTGALYYDAQAEAIRMALPTTHSAALTEAGYAAARASDDIDFYEWDNVRGFEIVYQTAYRVTFTTLFDYRGFILMFENPGNPQYGKFVTDVIAKNHYPRGESHATGPLSQ